MFCLLGQKRGRSQRWNFPWIVLCNYLNIYMYYIIILIDYLKVFFKYLAFRQFAWLWEIDYPKKPSKDFLQNQRQVHLHALTVFPCCKRKASSYNLHALLYPISLRFGLQCTMLVKGNVSHFNDLGFFFRVNNYLWIRQI